MCVINILVPIVLLLIGFVAIISAFREESPASVWAGIFALLTFAFSLVGLNDLEIITETKLVKLIEWCKANTFSAMIVGLIIAGYICVFIGIIKRVSAIWIQKNSARGKRLKAVFGKTSDFHFSISGALIGRKKELKQLEIFCKKAPDGSKQPFLFWIISGEGGSGKSKLCYEFLLKMKWRGWTTCLPQKNKEALNKASEHLPNKTLFMIDYAEYDTKIITEWLLELGQDNLGCKKNRNVGCRVRVLLIQRRPYEGGSFNDLRLNPYRYRDPLIMGQMGEKYLKSLISRSGKHYYKKKKKEHAKSKTKQTLHKLKKAEIAVAYDTLVTSVDPQKDRKRKGHAPLYAIILARAAVDSVKIEHEEDALEYVVHDHEQQRYRKLLMQLCRYRNVEYDEKLWRAIMTLLSIATMTRRWELTTENLAKIPHIYHNDIERFIELYRPPIDKRSPDFEIELFDWNDRTKHISIHSVEPDKIGGYFVCRWLKDPIEKEGLTEGLAEEIVSTAWNEIRQVTQFVLRLFQDFDKQPWLEKVMPIFSEARLPCTLQTVPKHAFLNYKYLTKITIPSTVRTIEYEAFLNCENLVQVKIEDGIKTIGRAAFSKCRLLRIVDMPASIEKVEIGAFERLSSKECHFPNGIARDDWFVEADHPRLFGGFEWKRLSEIIEEEDENGNRTGRRFRLLISKHVLSRNSFDSLSDNELLKNGGRTYSQSAIHSYLIGDFRNGLQDQFDKLPQFKISDDVHSGDEIWLLSENEFSKYFPSGSCVTDTDNNPSAWWLSTTDEINKRALFVTDTGTIHRAKERDDHDGMWVSDTCGLRPAFWLIED